MKVALIADPHFANHKMFGKLTNWPGVNQRLRAVSNTMRWIAEDVVEQEVGHVLILGDITHDHGRLTPPVMMEIRESLTRFQTHGTEVAMFSGNHDIDADGLSILPVFASINAGGPDISVLCSFDEDAEQIWNWPMEQNLFVIPYGTRDTTVEMLRWIEQYWQDGRHGVAGRPYVFMHHSFDGAKTGPHEFTPPASLKVSDIPEVIGGVFSGHYHLHQKLHKKMMYVGAPLQHDFGETHYTPGYMILDFDEKKCVLRGVSRRETPEDVAPRFYALPHTTDPSTPPGNPDQDYYRIELPANVDVGEIEELKKVLTNVVVRSIALGVDTRSRVEEYLKDEQKAEGRVVLPDVIDAYAVMNESNETRAKELASVGREIAKEVLGEV